MKSFVKSITLIISLCLVIGSTNVVSAAKAGATSPSVSHAPYSDTSDFYQHILDNGTLSADKQLIIYDEAVYVYSDIARHANADTVVKEDNRSLKAGYYIANDISYEYTDTHHPLDTLDASPGQSFSFLANNKFTATSSATDSIKASRISKIAAAKGYAQTYTLTKAISSENNTASTKRYGLCKIYRVHTFDIYRKNIFGKSNFITAAVYYEPVSMVVHPLN